MEEQCTVDPVSGTVVCPPVPDPEALPPLEMWSCVVLVLVAVVIRLVFMYAERRKEKVRQ